MVLSLLMQNAKLLWQHEAAPADQGLAAGGPPPHNKPRCCSLCEAVGSSFGQSEQHLLSRGAAVHQSGCQGMGARCNARFRSATHLADHAFT